MESEKSRTIDNGEFLKILQLEYFSHKLRSQVYDRPEFIKMHNDIAERKKQKVLDLASFLHAPHIFESDRNFEQFYKNEFLQEYGLPKLQYTPKNEKHLSYWDKYYLFKKGTVVVWHHQEYKVKTNYPNEEMLVLEGVSVELSYIDVKIKLLGAITCDALK